jgi:acetoin utilization deacetylase AcuC-like enzyme
VRPPGHHALADRAMGSVSSTTSPVAARYAQQDLGLERVAIVDFDVHHGNGTEASLPGDDSVLFVSCTSGRSIRARAAREPADRDDAEPAASAGCGVAEYRAALRARSSRPYAASRRTSCSVSAGFDAHEEDPLASDGGDDGRLPRAGERLCVARGLGSPQVPGGRLQPGRQLPGLVACGARGLSS